MKKSRYTEEQIAFALRQGESGTPVKEVIRKLGILPAPQLLVSSSLLSVNNLCFGDVLGE